MEALEAQITQAVETGVIPGVVLLATNANGTFSYSRSFGHLSVREPRSREPLTQDTVLRLVSTGKLITQVCALQCVERGLIGLDDDVRNIVPDLKGLQVLSSFEGDTPIYTGVEGKITLRNLLSHSSGFSYTPIDPLLIKYRKLRDEIVEPKTGSLTERYLYPLTAQPGERWMYSPGVDWAGRIIEVLTGRTLEDYIHDNISKPLGTDSITFFVQRRADLMKRRVELTGRNKDTGKLEPAHESYFDEDAEDCLGGMGIWGTALDLFKVCQSLLADNGLLLQSETIKAGLMPQLGEHARETLNTFLKNEDIEKFGMGGGFQHLSHRDSSLLGMVLLEENERTPRKVGCVAWTAYPQIYYVSAMGNAVDEQFVDRKADLCGVFAAHMVPPGDSKMREFHLAWERAIYAERERLAASGAK